MSENKNNKTKAKSQTQKTLVIEDELYFHLEALCNALYTNFATKTKDLLVEWKIRELKRLKEDAPDVYELYKEKLEEIKSKAK